MDTYIGIVLTAVYFLKYSEGANCGEYTGAISREYDFDYATDSQTNAQKRLSLNEHNSNHRNTEFVMNSTLYTIDCACGAVTMWEFYAWKAGITVFYVLDGTEVKGKTSVYIGEQSVENFFEVPLSSDMWIPVQIGYTLGFFTEGEPMITLRYGQGYNMYFNRNKVEKNVSQHVEPSGNMKTNRRYAFAAFVEDAHPPMFVNAPFETTVYTHEINSVVYTANILDLDGTDVVTVTDLTLNPAFVFDPAALTLTYSSVLPGGQYVISLQASDGCPTASHTVTETITINLVNEGPTFNNLPASTTVNEAATAMATLYTIAATDASGDTVTCSIDSVNPSAGSSIFSIFKEIELLQEETCDQYGSRSACALAESHQNPYCSRKASGAFKESGSERYGSDCADAKAGFDIVQKINPNYDYSSAKYYDLRISCTDTETTRYSNFQVDVIQNEPPVFNTGSGYLPASISVDRSSGVTIYQLDFSDPEGESVTVTATSCSGCTGVFTVSTSGEVTTASVLGAEGYDLYITITDADQKSSTEVLSVVTSGRPYTFNSVPVFVHQMPTQYVMEHTAVGTFLLKVLYTDENPTDTFTLAKDSVSNAAVDTYFAFDTSTGIISVKADIDFEPTGARGWEMEITVTDGSEAQHVSVTGTVTFTIVNVNEGVTLSIANPAIAADETPVGGIAFPDPVISVADIDSGDTHYFTMDCGDNSKYFYLDTTTNLVHFAREYDMDSGLSGTATCNVSVRDQGGLYDSGLLTLTVNNINDHDPKFPHNFYVFFVSTSTTFYTQLADIAASDADSDTFGSTNGVLTYSFDPASPTGDYFQIDSAGVLYVRNLTTYTSSTYVFRVVATDSGGHTGTCTVTAIFSGVAATTTTTTERTLVFKDDYKNYFWLLLVAIGLFATLVVISLIIWKDPVVNEYVGYKIYKLSEWCRGKPKRREPRRTVGKLTVTVNNKKLENDPDNALPWELMAKDADIPEVNELQEVIEKRKEKQDRDYKNFVGLPVFEKGKGSRPESGRATVHSSRSSGSKSESPKYATFMPHEVENNEEHSDSGEGQWGDLNERRIIRTPVTPFKNEVDDRDTVVNTPVEPFEYNGDQKDLD